jgi:hypothetical protein
MLEGCGGGREGGFLGSRNSSTGEVKQVILLVVTSERE